MRAIRTQTPRWLRRSLFMLGLVAALTLAASWVVGSLVTRAVPVKVGQVPADLQGRSLVFNTAAGVPVHGWWLDPQPTAQPRRQAVLLLHGIKGSRWQMVQRARDLVGLGYTVLMIDLPAHGESGGEQITFGYRERDAVTAAFAQLRSQFDAAAIGVIGVSLGGISAVMADWREPPGAMIVEFVVPTLREAIDNRLQMRLGPAGSWLAPLLTWQMPWRLGFDVDAVRPIDHLAKLKAPVLYIAGERDEHTLLAQSQRLFEAAPEPKQLWVVPGARHQNLDEYVPDAYRARISGFLQQHLAMPAM